MPILKIWDEETQKYIGIPAIKGETGKTGEKGDTGPQGPQGEPGISTKVNGIVPDETGNVTLTAADVGALASSGGDMTGPINMNGQSISGLNDPVEDNQAARKGYVDASVRRAAPRNLLNNSDFTNPVNQRGLTSVTQGNSAVYFIDRWRVGRGTATITDDGIKLAWDGTNGTNFYLAQKLSGKWTVGDKYTVAIKINGEIKSVITPITSSTNLVSIDGTTVKIALTSSDNQILQLAIYHYDTTNVIYAWAALYKGEYTTETLPEYQPKGYVAELLECQRYYQRFSSGTQTYFVFALGYMQSATSCRFFLPLTVPMRTKPTINSPEAVYFNYGPSSTRVAVSGFAVNNMLPNQVFISSTTASEVTMGTIGEVMTTTSTGNYIELLADL